MLQPPCISIVQYTDRLRRRIDVALAARCEPGDGCPPVLCEAMRYSLLGPGKRLRPVLVLLAARACGASDEAAMPAACSVEMIHAYSLIHDDLPAMDNDDLRRGRPTCHKAFDQATAILAGDALLTRAFEVLAGEIEPPRVAAACCATLAEAAGACGMVGGQADDIAHQGETAHPEDLGRLESIHGRKTGAMIGAALRLGGLVAGADTAKMVALQRYGRCLGLAFQITDDLLDVRGEEATVGKRLGKDVALGKLTFPGLIGIPRSRQRVEQLVSQACEALKPFAGAGEHLEALARYVQERNR
ncbi:MAG: polyprenyl synthetase family protein [Planctomycetes bacterium]|nr:polyprenyl synthetase family protein [Planctomycetota bacterium]